MADHPKPNKPLFSQHYLEHRLPEYQEWQLEVREGFEAFNRLYQSNKDLLPTLNEAQTEEVFIKPALDILGFSHIPQVTTYVRGRAERPDYALFTDQADRDVAYPLQNDEPAFYARVKAIAEAKYWERPLSKVSANDQRDVYKNENPSFQISSYLIGTGVDWGILTNGREWRLYYRQASSTATEFYPVDLVDLLESGDLEQFKYFWLFFRREALIKDPQGRNFLERVREGSTTYATRVGNELKALVFDRVFPGLAGGFVADATRRGETVTPEQVYEATLAFLYKLLFLLYAEARNLLPIDRDYREYSLIKMTQEVAQGVVQQKRLSQTSTGLYDRLLSLFQIIDRGDPGLAVPCYNGGLFHFDFSQPSDRVEYRANHFLSQFKVSDAVLAPVLDQLARFEGQPIDYSFLGVRQLGSIYEGLLEYRVVIEDGKTGKVYLENDKGDRKATGSYYTPDYIVKYIISHTLNPILEQRQARFAELMGQIAQIHHQLKDKRLGTQSQQGLRKDLQRLERETQSTLLDIKVCDPAMGSGHFLVEAVDYLTDELIRILNAYPERNPVLEMLDQTRQSILENLEQQGIVINPDRLEPTQLLQRVVMKRCIYGVDLNPMAVELAKVSLWLHSFTIGAPLSFLDHHLRCGNSLIGTTAREAESAMSKDSGGQFTLLTGPFVGLLRAAEIMRGVSILSDVTFAEVEQSERLFRSFDEAAKPFKRLLDIYVAKFFGLKRADHFLRVFGTGAITADPQKMNKADAAVYKNAQKLSDEKHFFHWDLEFPEVFIDLENSSWKENSGFDAVVGNPPYVSNWELTSYDKSLPAILEKFYPDVASGHWDLFVLFTYKALSLTKAEGYQSFIVPSSFATEKYGTKIRKFILDEYSLIELVDFEKHLVFENVSRYLIIYVISPFRNILNPVKIFRFQENFYEFTTVIQNTFYGFTNFAFRVDITESEILIKVKIQNQSIFLGSICHVNMGIVAHSSASSPIKFKKNQVIKNHDGNGYRRFILGTDITPYEINWNNLFIDYESKKNHFHRSRFIELFESPKIVIRRVSGEENQLISSYDEESYFSDHLVIQIIIWTNKIKSLEVAGYELAYERAEQYKLHYVLSLINSRIITYYFSHFLATDTLQGSYTEVYPESIRQFPIRKINFTTPTDRRQKALQNTIDLYQNFQSNHNPDALLTQVDSHLNQQPEESDVIHDVLAYLAEQMIELNKQKQTEIKGFLQWLERFIGCPINTLTNKSKIQNYLGNYYKKGTGSVDTENDTGEPHLSFNALIELLKKNKKKIKIDPTARKEQQTLEKEYQASLDTLLPIKMQLMRCDNLIDQIVYKLYGLTEEEIAIVEGRHLTNESDR